MAATTNGKRACSDVSSPAAKAPRLVAEGEVLGSVEEWLGRVRAELYQGVLPFWMKHSVDRDNGGFFTCLDRDGTVFDRTKYIWLQGRQVWMLATLVEERTDATLKELSGGKLNRSDMLDAATKGAEFLRKHAVREDGQVYFSLTADGKPKFLQRKIFGACFMCMGLNELAAVSGRPELRKEALTMFDRILSWVKEPTALGRPALDGEPALSPLAVPMILLNLIEELRKGALAEELKSFYPDTERWCVVEIMKHAKKDRRLVFENVAADETGSVLEDIAEGRMLNPGHAIECGWFLLGYAKRAGDESLKQQAIEIIDWMYEYGWDKEHGGLLYFMDSSGRQPTALEWSMKLWWPHCEAMVAYAMVYQATKEVKYWNRFVEVATYTLKHFSDFQDGVGAGEWFGYLDRRHDRTHDMKGGPYKGCFHVPRALFVVENVLASVLAEK